MVKYEAQDGLRAAVERGLENPRADEFIAVINFSRETPNP
jgi:hypothetical protein